MTKKRQRSGSSRTGGWTGLAGSAPAAIAGEPRCYQVMADETSRHTSFSKSPDPGLAAPCFGLRESAEYSPLVFPHYRNRLHGAFQRKFRREYAVQHAL